MNNQNYAKEATIAQIEKQKQFFEIPPYQRLYEWEKDEIETLLDDMKKAWKPDDCQSNKSNAGSQKSGKQYFIGNITTSIDKNDNNKFILIDGQQRLTTLWFIGFYLASKGCDEWKEFITQDEKVRIAMSIRDNEENALKELAMKIQNDTIKPNENSEINLYTYLPSDIHQKIINAFECIEKWFNAMFGKYANGKLEIDLKQLKCFSLFIYIRVCFVFVELAENTDLNRFFVRMNNRGKQLEKHEILKARILSVIQQGGGEWQKYAKIWDLCSDMNKYVFQSASDRNIFADSKDKKGQDNSGQSIDEIINNPSADNNNNANKNDDTPDKVESIIDFPTFLLHCYKLWITKQCNDKIEKITIAKDNLLEIMWENKNSDKKEILCDDFIFNSKNSEKAKQNCENFIKYILYYRVLFDYFVIKNDVRARSGNNYKIMRLSKNEDNYNLPENSKKGELTSGVLHDLAMIQNYLRVARQGDRQNYHHWLTPFLLYLNSEEICKQIWKDYIPKDNFKKIDEIAGLFKTDTEDKKAETANEQKPYNETNMITFLENLDTKLAIKQLSKTNENVLLNTANTILININEHLNFQEEKSKIQQISKWREKYKNIFFHKKCFLNNGTGTPHYWFYRLEYYLWKDRESKKYAEVNFDNKSFTDIADKFYFRNLNSVEHIYPQSKAEDWQIYKDKENKIIKRDIDCFGNLALLSVGFNSALSNQDNADKRLDLQKKINKSDAESLKLWLVYALYIKEGNEWTYENAQEHQNQMIDILTESLGLNSR